MISQQKMGKIANSSNSFCICSFRAYIFLCTLSFDLSSFALEFFIDRILQKMLLLLHYVEHDQTVWKQLCMSFKGFDEARTEDTKKNRIHLTSTS